MGSGALNEETLEAALKKARFRRHAEGTAGYRIFPCNNGYLITLIAPSGATNKQPERYIALATALALAFPSYDIRIEGTSVTIQ